jgi:hypothetical protein
MTTTVSSPNTILIAGHWLGAWAWDEVLEQLDTAVAITLPGLDGDDPERAARTLDDQVAGKRFRGRPSAPVLDMARGGHPLFAEVAKLENLDVVDLPTGHWPMWSRPRDLAQVIRSAASRTD